MHGFSNIEEHGSLFTTLFFECTTKICQLLWVSDENGATIILDFDKEGRLGMDVNNVHPFSKYIYSLLLILREIETTFQMVQEMILVIRYKSLYLYMS